MLSFKDIKNSFQRIIQIGQEPHQNFFQIFFNKQGCQKSLKLFILEGATGPMIEQWPKCTFQFSPDKWITIAESFKLKSWSVSDQSIITEKSYLIPL